MPKNRPPIAEIPVTSRSQPLPLPASVFETPEPETAARIANYRQPTAIKTIRQQPQLDIVHIPNIEYPSPSRRLSTDNSILHLSSPSIKSALRLIPQHTQPLSTASNTTHS